MPKPPSHEKLELEQARLKSVDADDLCVGKEKTALSSGLSDPGPKLVAGSEPSLAAAGGASPAGRPATEEASSDNTASDTLVGSTISGRYQIIEKLGSGGMSTVYRVKHLHLERTLALKFLHQVSQSSIQRFQLEAKAATLLEHPNIVRVHDFGVTSKGQPYMTMDCIEGESLADILSKNGPLPMSRLTRLFGQICSGLAHAHEQGVVHRDLKPSNIIVKSNEAIGDQAIIVDFGIAKILDHPEETSENKFNLTRTGDVFGTPLYMSPEQGQGYKVDARSDIYSLACVMYEAATGVPPFQGESVYHIIHKQITEAPAPFPENLRRTSAGRKLESMLLKALAKNPDDRHKYMVEMTSELKSIEAGKAGFWSELEAFSSSLKRRVRATERKSVVLKFSLQALVVLALILGSVIVSFPKEILLSNYRISQDEQILNLLSDIFNFKKPGQESRAVFITSPVKAKVKYLDLLCANLNHEQSISYKAFRKRIGETLSTGNRFGKMISAFLDDNSMNSMEFLQAQGTLASVVTDWSDSNLLAEKFRDRTTAKISRTEQKVQLMSWAFIGSLALAPVCSLLLAFLATISWLQSRKTVVDGKLLPPLRQDNK